LAKRMRGLYKRGKVWWCCYKALDNKLVRESTCTTNFDDAVDFLLKRRNNIEAVRETKKKKFANYSFGDLSEQYQERRLKGNTY